MNKLYEEFDINRDLKINQQNCEYLKDALSKMVSEELGIITENVLLAFSNPKLQERIIHTLTHAYTQMKDRISLTLKDGLVKNFDLKTEAFLNCIRAVNVHYSVIRFIEGCLKQTRLQLKIVIANYRLKNLNCSSVLIHNLAQEHLVNNLEIDSRKLVFANEPEQEIQEILGWRAIGYRVLDKADKVKEIIKNDNRFNVCLEITNYKEDFKINKDRINGIYINLGRYGLICHDDQKQQQIFNKINGRFNGKNIYIRFPDLKDFLEQNNITIDMVEDIDHVIETAIDKYVEYYKVFITKFKRQNLYFLVPIIGAMTNFTVVRKKCQAIKQRGMVGYRKFGFAIDSPDKINQIEQITKFDFGATQVSQFINQTSQDESYNLQSFKVLYDKYIRKIRNFIKGRRRSSYIHLSQRAEGYMFDRLIGSGHRNFIVNRNSLKILESYIETHLHEKDNQTNCCKDRKKRQRLKDK